MLAAAILLILPQTAHSQSDDDKNHPSPELHKIDSLLSLIKPDSPDSTKAKLCAEIADNAVNPDTIIKYARLSLKFCSDDNIKLVAGNNNLICFAYYKVNEFDSSLFYLKKNVELCSQAGLFPQLLKSYRNIATIFEAKNISDSTFSYLNKALDISIRANDTLEIAECYYVLAVFAFNKQLYENAEKDGLHAAHLDSLINNVEGVAQCNMLLGMVYSGYADTNDALSMLHKSLNYLKNAVSYYDTISSNNMTALYQKYIVHDNLAYTYIQLATLTADKTYADSCIAYYKPAAEFFLQYNLIDSYMNCAKTYTEYLLFLKKYKEAKEFALSLGKYVDDNMPVEYKHQYYALLEYVYETIGDWENAFKTQKVLNKYSKEFLNDSTLNVIAETKAQQAVMLEKLEREKDLQIHAAERSRMRAINTLLIGIVLLGVILFFFYKTAKENEENKLRNKALEVERSLLRTQMNPHFIFNALNSIQNFVLNSNAAEAVRFLSKFAKLMRMILNNSMVQSVTLNNELQSLSLYLDLERARFSNKFNYRIDIDNNIEEDLISIPPMLIQPFIENAIIHGLMHKTYGEGLITIKITENDNNSLTCQITDNGVGRKAAAEFEKNSERKHKSVGMQLTRDRLRDLNNEANAKMSCVITDLEDEADNALGTQVTIIIPITESEEDA